MIFSNLINWLFAKKKNDLNEEYIIISKEDNTTMTDFLVSNTSYPLSCENNLNTINCNNYLYDLSVGNAFNIMRWITLYYSLVFIMDRYTSIFENKYINVLNYADLLCASFNTIYFLYSKNVYVMISYYLYDLLRMYIQGERDHAMVFHHITTLSGLCVCPANSCYTILINNTVAVKVNDVFLYSKKLIENSPLNSLFPRFSNILVICLTSTTTFWWMTYRTHNLLTFRAPSLFYTTLQYSLLALTVGYSYIMTKSLRSSIKKFIHLNF